MLELKHKNLEVYKRSLELTTLIYKITAEFPNYELYELVSQIRRASVSIISNISEGSSRKSPQERKRFFEISRSSLVELDTQIEISVKLQYISSDYIEQLHHELNEIFAMICSLINNTK